MVGRLFHNQHRPRVSLDLKVGSSHVVEVLLQLRRSDWEWYQANEQVIEDELLELLEESVLSRMFSEEIEEFHRKYNPQIFPPDNKKVGTKNNKKSDKKNAKRTRRGANKHLADIQQKREELVGEEKKVKDVYYAFGEILQLAYRKQDLPTWNQDSKTVFFKDSDDDDGFYDRPKLPARLLVWCSKINPQNITNPDPDNVGFFREEMIPISSLFREPKESE